MVLSDEQKKALVERLRLGKEKKATVAPLKKGLNPKLQPTEEPASKPAPKAANKPAPAQEPPVNTDKPPKKAVAKKPAHSEEPEIIPFEEPLPPPRPETPPAKKCVFENIEQECADQQAPPSRKDKRLNKQKYMAIKFYEKPDERLYKRVMKSVQPESSSDEEPMHDGLQVLDYQAAKKEKITEAQKIDVEKRKMEAIIRLLG